MATSGDFISSKRFEQWEEVAEPPLEDWLSLLDAVRRRISRKKIPEQDEKKLVRLIRARFPEAEI